MFNQNTGHGNREQEIMKLQMQPSGYNPFGGQADADRKSVIKQNYEVVKQQMDEKEKLKMMEKQMYQLDKSA